MGFAHTIQKYDAEHGLPRRADEAYLPSVHAFYRCMKDGGLILISVTPGLLTLCCLIVFAFALGLGFYGWLFVFILQAIVIGVVLIEASQVLLPYHDFNQLLTYGTAHWASPVYLEGAGLARRSGDDSQRGELQLGKLPRPFRRPYRFIIPADSVLGSFIFFGAPGMGKSVMLMNYLRLWAQHQCSAIILDPKGELYEYCARFFERVYRIDFTNPEQTDRWNFLLQCRGNSEYAHIMAAAIIGLEGTKQTVADPFWAEAELALLTAILLYLPLRIDHPTPPMIHQYIASRTLDQLRADLGTCPSQDVKNQWGTFTKASDITQGSVFTGLAAKLHPFTIDAAKAVCAQILLPEWERGARYVDFAHLRQPGVAIFVVIPEGAASRYKMPLGTFFAEAIEHLRRGEVDDEAVPVLLVIDESAHIPIVNMKEGVGVGRGRRFSTMLFYQNIAQGYDQYGEHGFNAIIESINVKTFLPGCGHTTTQYAAQLVGETTVWSHTFDDAPGTENDKTRSSEAARPLITPAEVRQLLKFKQALTIVETMPPVKWTMPASVKTGARLIPRKFGKPRLLSIQEAERITLARRERKALQAGANAAQDGAADAGQSTTSDSAAVALEQHSSNGNGSSTQTPPAACSEDSTNKQAKQNPSAPEAAAANSSSTARPPAPASSTGDAEEGVERVVEERDSHTISKTISPSEAVDAYLRANHDAMAQIINTPLDATEQILNNAIQSMPFASMSRQPAKEHLRQP